VKPFLELARPLSSAYVYLEVLAHPAPSAAITLGFSTGRFRQEVYVQ